MSAHDVFSRTVNQIPIVYEFRITEICPINSLLFGILVCGGVLCDQYQQGKKPRFVERRFQKFCRIFQRYCAVFSDTLPEDWDTNPKEPVSFPVFSLSGLKEPLRMNSDIAVTQFPEPAYDLFNQFFSPVPDATARECSHFFY